MNVITIESRFWVPENAIRPDTRNICSKELVAMIYRVSEVLYPDETIEVLILPSEVWSYKDIFKITGGISIVSVLWFIWRFLTYQDSHEEHKLQMFKDCFEVIQNIEWYTWGDLIISDEQFNNLCEDHWITRIKNNRYKTLAKDETIEYEETVIKNTNNQVLLQKTIQRNEFQNMIIPLPEDEDFEQKNITWVIELVSLVIKQKKEWKWIPRKWIYYGENIVYSWIEILTNNEEVNFFMQDKEFRKKIYNHTYTFGSWDNISVLFDLKGEIKAWMMSKKNMYVTKVVGFNDVEIIHKTKTINNTIQTWLFS